MSSHEIVLDIALDGCTIGRAEPLRQIFGTVRKCIEGFVAELVHLHYGGEVFEPVQVVGG